MQYGLPSAGGMSLQRLEQDLKSAERNPDTGNQNVSQCLRALGSYHDSKCEYEQALMYYNRNVNIWKKNKSNRKLMRGGGDKRTAIVRNYGNAIHDVSLTYKYMENYEDSERFGLQFVELMEDEVGKKSKHMVLPVLSMVKLYDEMKDEAKMKVFSKRLRQLIEKNNIDPAEYGITQNQREGKATGQKSSEVVTQESPFAGNGAAGDPFSSLGDLASLLDSQSLILRRRVQRMQQQGDLAQAEALCLEFLSDEKNNNLAQTSEVHKMLIDIYIAQKNFEKAADSVAKIVESGGPVAEAMRPLEELFRSYDSLPASQQDLLYNSIVQDMKATSGPGIGGRLHTGPSGVVQQVPEGFCSNGCGKQETDDTKFNVCARCRQAKYCGRDCQVAHWKGGHKRLCKKK